LRVAILARAVHRMHGYGGLERHVFDLVRHLLSREIDVTLITRAPAGRTAAALRAGGAGPGRPVDFSGNKTWAGSLAHQVFGERAPLLRLVPYRTFPFAGRRGTTVIDRSTAYLLFGYRAGRLAARLAVRGEVDLVHGLGASALGYALERRSSTGMVPFVFNPQGLEEFGGADGRFGGARLKRVAYLPLQWAVRRCARAADRVLATDRTLVPLVQRLLRVEPERIALVPNAIDLAECDRLASPSDGARMRAAHDIGPQDALLLSVGRLEENKGFHVLVGALAKLAGQTWRWALVGDGPFRPTLERLVASHDLGARVVMAGRVSEGDLHAWYEAATLFVHPTLYEGSSLVTLEAMAHRRPVLATFAGGLPDKVTPGVTGWLVQPGDDAGLVVALLDALSQRDRLEDMGSAGRSLAAREFSWPVVAERMVQLYGELATQETLSALRRMPDLH
jgi:glycosyltransferase involved in cell wall biosynthesis